MNPKNINSRLDNLERAFFGYFKPVYKDGAEPSAANPTPAILQHEEIQNGKPVMVDTLEYVPGVIDRTAALESVKNGTFPAGEGYACGAAYLDALEAPAAEKTPRKGKGK